MMERMLLIRYFLPSEVQHKPARHGVHSREDHGVGGVHNHGASTWRKDDEDARGQEIGEDSQEHKENEIHLILGKILFLR